MTTKTNTNPWLMDSRVRERNLKSGALTEKDLEKNLAALPDLEGQYDAVTTPQPALEQPRIVAPVVDESDSDLDDESDSDLDDESDDDDDDDAEGGDDDAKNDEGGGGGGGEAEGEAPAADGGGDEPTNEGGEQA